MMNFSGTFPLRLVSTYSGRMEDLKTESDEELLRRSTAGDEEAFAILFRRRQAAVYRFALHMSGRADIAEEVTQEVFLSLIRDPGRFDSSRGALASYLFGVARNRVLRWLDQTFAYVNMEEGSWAETAAEDGDLLARLTREEAISSVRQAILTLPGVYREAVVLCDLEELTYAEAASILDVPVGTVRSRLNRGRGMLLGKLRSGKAAVRSSA